MLCAMNQLLDKALQAVQLLPEREQDEIARLLLDLTRQDDPETIDSAHLPDVLKGLDQMRRGEFANAAQVEAAFRRFGA